MKWIYGILLLVLIASLCALFGLGHVEEKTSYGLLPLIGGLLVLAGGYAQSVFGKKDE